MNRRSIIVYGALAAFFTLAAPGCGSDKPRSLVVADGSGTAHTVGVDARARAFEKHTGRQVRVMIVPPAQAVTLASRGEADIALVPVETNIDTFLASEHGRVVGVFKDQGEQLRILEVNAAQHPKVDAKGAKDLAAAYISPP